MTNLSVFFRPKGIAIIGASRDPIKLGYGVVRNLVEHHFEGGIYPVNPHADEIVGVKCYSSVQDVPDPVDLAIIVVAAPLVEDELLACAERGIQAVTIISGGFREAGPDGATREARIKTIVTEHDMALLGPNCIGTIDTHTPLNSTFIAGHPRHGDIAFVSQSGAIVAAVIDWARGAGVGFSRMVSLGNQAGISEVEMLEAVAQDPHTDVITAYVEGVSDGMKFVETASQISQHKPMIALKVGRSAGGAQAVASHTGALAGSEAAYDAAFRRAGVLRASRLEEMLDWARALAWQPLPQGNRVAVLTNAGGAGVMAVDALEAAGMQLAPLTDETRIYLDQRLPGAASVRNPVDILAGSGPASYALCLDGLLSDPTVDAVVVLTAPQDWFSPLSLAEVIGEVSNSPLGRRKPVLAVIMGLASTSEAQQVLHRRRVPNFAFPERIGSTLAAMWQRKQWLDQISDQATRDDLPFISLPDDLCDNLEQHDGWLEPPAVEQLLHTYAIPTPATHVVMSPDAAVEVADRIGYPVVLKLVARDVTHKTDVGGIRLNLKTADAVHEAAHSLLNHGAVNAVEGILVQPMFRDGVEAIIGMVRDDQFGPLMMVGSGGVQVELFKDTVFELAPIAEQQATDMVDRTRLAGQLAGYRGRPPADRAVVVDVLQKLSRLALDCPRVMEIEINPLIVLAQGQGGYAVDARVRVGSSTSGEEA